MNAECVYTYMAQKLVGELEAVLALLTYGMFLQTKYYGRTLIGSYEPVSVSVPA